jgi:hypothetical protein
VVAEIDVPADIVPMCAIGAATKLQVCACCVSEGGVSSGRLLNREMDWCEIISLLS